MTHDKAASAGAMQDKRPCNLMSIRLDADARTRRISYLVVIEHLPRQDTPRVRQRTPTDAIVPRPRLIAHKSDGDIPKNVLAPDVARTQSQAIRHDRRLGNLTGNDQQALRGRF